MVTLRRTAGRKSITKKSDYQDIVYFSQPQPKQNRHQRSLDEVCPKLSETYEKLGHSVEQNANGSRAWRWTRFLIP